MKQQQKFYISYLKKNYVIIGFNICCLYSLRLPVDGTICWLKRLAEENSCKL